MAPESIMLSERNQRKTNTIRFHLHVEPKNKTNEQTKQNSNRFIDTENKLVVARVGGAERLQRSTGEARG